MMDELTRENFMAVLAWDVSHPGEVRPHWLCSSSEFQTEMHQEAELLYQAWREKELEMEQKRNRKG